MPQSVHVESVGMTVAQLPGAQCLCCKHTALEQVDKLTDNTNQRNIKETHRNTISVRPEALLFLVYRCCHFSRPVSLLSHFLRPSGEDPKSDLWLFTTWPYFSRKDSMTNSHGFWVVNPLDFPTPPDPWNWTPGQSSDVYQPSHVAMFFSRWPQPPLAPCAEAWKCQGRSSTQSGHP